MNESKSSRFKRKAEARVDKITKMLRLLGNCSNKSNYEYTEEQVGKIIAKLYFELDKLAYSICMRGAWQRTVFAVGRTQFRRF